MGRNSVKATMLRQKSALAFFNVVAIRQISPQQGAKSRKLGCTGKGYLQFTLCGQQNDFSEWIPWVFGRHKRHLLHSKFVEKASCRAAVLILVCV